MASGGNAQLGCWDGPSLLDAISVPVTVLDAQGRIAYANRAAEEISGASRSRLLGAFMWDVLTPTAEAAALRSLLEEALACGGPAGREIHWRVADGSLRLMSCVGVPLGGPTPAVVLTACDAHERRRIEQELHTSRERLQDVMSNAPVVLFALDERGTFLLSEGKGLERLGLRPGQVVGRSIFDLYGNHPAILENFRRALGGDTFKSTVGVDGSVFEVWYSPLRDAGGRVTGVIGVAVDVTDRVHVERYLWRRLELEKLLARISADFLNRVPEQVDAAVTEALRAVGEAMGVDRTYLFLLSEDGATVRNTHEWCAAGIAPQRERLQDVAVAKFRWWMDHLERREPIYVSRLADLPPEAAAERAAFEARQIRSVLAVPLSWGGRLMGFVGFESVRGEKSWSPDDAALLETLSSIFAGALEREAAERRRKQLEEQLRQAQKMEAVGRLAGGVAHDFNNLLTIISGYAHLLAAGDLAPEELQPTAREILQAAGRAMELTQQLLTFSRRQVAEPRLIDLNEVVARMESWLRRTAGDHVDLVLNLQPGRAPVVADPAQIEQVLINLALNARDAMPEGGRLVVETGAAQLSRPEPALGLGPGHYITLSLCDSGCGMEADVRSRIFEPFFTTKEPGKGTGLGLSIVYGIVKEHRGEIAVESAPGRGTRITIYFPRALSAETGRC
ncbi:MAG: PAS domain S-box protein [Bryobacterales bacterium]|nr:PAS domain S-box protein [Bryobacteraceae bacterium]MDW8356001.1 PAS domain S-box protein [Bryobacterales bacterium]